MRFNELREWVWPLLEEEDEPYVENVPTEINISDEALDLGYDLNLKALQEEEERRKSIESKATLLIGTISIASSLLLAASTLVINQKPGGANGIISISVFFSCIMTIYAARTVWFSIKALERANYSVLGISDINVANDKTEYKKHIIMCMMKMRVDNQAATNRKVDNMTMAQEYYKRGLVTICIYSIVVFCVCLLNTLR